MVVGPPVTHSGARYDGVPSTRPVAVRSLDSVLFAIPKSATLASPDCGQQDVCRLDVPMDQPAACAA